MTCVKVHYQRGGGPACNIHTRVGPSAVRGLLALTSDLAEVTCGACRRTLRPGPKVDTGRPHGTTAAYAAGCRCDSCRAALAAYRHNYNRGVRIGRGGRTCGRIATYHAGCRCDDCRRAARETRARARARARARGESREAAS